MMRSFVLFCLAISLGSQSCGDVLTRMESKPRALGKTNEIIAVADATVWQSFVGDTVSYYFEAPYPIMPQPEPIFDVRHFTVEDLETAELRKELRTYLILANLSDTSSDATRMVRRDLGEERLRRAREDSSYFSSTGQDKWATGQLLIYVFGYGLDQLAHNVVKAYPSIARRVNQHDLNQVDASTYLHRESVPIGQRIREKFGVSMKIPGDFRIAADEENFIWIRQDRDVITSSIMMMRFPYDSQEQFTREGMIRMRDRMSLEVEGSTAGSYMVTNVDDLPVLTYQKEIAGHYAVEARGIWELTDDYLGGPFVSYAILDEGEILMIDCFIAAPGEDKRDHIQRLEHVIASLRFSSVEE